MNTELYDYIAKKIKDLREKARMSQDTLADKIGVTPNTISRWETATYKPRAIDLQKLANFFSVPISELFPADNKDSQPNMAALLSASKGLTAEDISTLTEFAEFRKARRLLEKAKKSK